MILDNRMNFRARRAGQKDFILEELFKVGSGYNTPVPLYQEDLALHRSWPRLLTFPSLWRKAWYKVNTTSWFPALAGELRMTR
jgi:hypothetical protein